MSLSADHSYGPSIRGATIGKSNRVDLVLIRTPDWLDQAACKDHDPEWWFGSQHGPATNSSSRLTGDEHHDNKVRAWRICQTCPVKDPCLTRGKTTKSTGLWGGQWLSGDEQC